MSDEAKFVLGFLVALAALAGLFVASWAVHGLWYWVGLGVFVAGVIGIFLVIRLIVRTPHDSPEAKAPPGQ
jgi:hypothetical protein